MHTKWERLFCTLCVIEHFIPPPLVSSLLGSQCETAQTTKNENRVTLPCNCCLLKCLLCWHKCLPSCPSVSSFLYGLSFWQLRRSVKIGVVPLWHTIVSARKCCLMSQRGGIPFQLIEAISSFWDQPELESPSVCLHRKQVEESQVSATLFPCLSST